MTRLFHLLLVSAFALVSPLFLASCQTGNQMQGIQDNKLAVENAIKAEDPNGDYWIGRRYYKVDYKFWGWLRRPGQPWKTAKLVMMNEQDKLAPDRESGRIGSDNGYEYKLYGQFSPDVVYEPASDTKYPEFRLKRAELVSVAPPNIFHVPGALDPTRRIIPQPY